MSSLTAPIMFRASRSAKSTLCIKKYHTSGVMYLDQRRREIKRLPKNPNSFGPLTTLPDYTFADNRPTPYGSNQLKRIQEHQEHVKKIVKLVGEIDYAVERHAKLVKQMEAERQQILDNKLKPKGQELITSN